MQKKKMLQEFLGHRFLVFALFMLIFSGGLKAAEEEYQKKKISVQIVNETIEQALNKIGNIADIRFFYNHASFDFSKKININITDKELRDAIGQVAAVVTQVPVQTYYDACLRNWKKEQEILEGIRDKVDPFAFNYIYAELEGMYLDNLVKYPFIVSDVNKKPLQECTPKGYWEALDGYQVKSDKASLKSYAYIGWLIDYLEYREKCEARKAGKEYKPAGNMEEMYEKLVNAYEGDTRDAVLYLFLYNAISKQQDFDVIKTLSKDYFKKYNKNKKFKKELTEMQK